MKEFFKNLFWSKFISGINGAAKKVAFIGMLMALSVISNMFFEFKMLDTQFSLTITVSAVIGFIAGPICGAGICFLGDLLGFFVNSGGYAYMPWVGLSTAAFAFIAGLLSMKKSGGAIAYAKIGAFTVLSLLICTIGINSLGFYLYNMNLGFSPAVKAYVAELFGGEQVTFLGYVAYRLIFKLQILNNVFNYAVIFVLYAVASKIKPLEKVFE